MSTVRGDARDPVQRWAPVVIAGPICALLFVVTNGLLDPLALAAFVCCSLFVWTGSRALLHAVLVIAGVGVGLLLLGLSDPSISKWTPRWASFLGMLSWGVLAAGALATERRMFGPVLSEPSGATGEHAEARAGLTPLRVIFGLGGMLWSLLTSALVILGASAFVWGGTDDAKARCLAHEFGVSNSLIDSFACIVRH